jgi:hypothetical protein
VSKDTRSLDRGGQAGAAPPPGLGVVEEGPEVAGQESDGGACVAASGDQLYERLIDLGDRNVAEAMTRAEALQELLDGKTAVRDGTGR